MKYAFSQSWKDLNMSPVIVHGDFHAGNMIWKVDKNEEIINEIYAIYDWQLWHEGSPMADLAKLLVLCSDGWTRRRVEDFIFDFYHDALEKEMNKIGKSCPFTVDQIRKAYNYMYLTQSYSLVMMFRLINEVFAEESPRVKEAITDDIILRCKHSLEDMDKLLTGEMKDLYEKFGQ